MSDENGEELPKPLKRLMVFGAVIIILILVGWFILGGSGLGTVSGKVVLEGQPLPGAQIVFVGEGQNRGPFVTTSDPEGRYNIRGDGNKGIAPGSYKVAVTKLVGKGGVLPQGEALEVARQKGTLKNLLHSRYETAQTSPLGAVVGSGSNKVDLDLKKNP